MFVVRLGNVERLWHSMTSKAVLRSVIGLDEVTSVVFVGFEDSDND